LQTTLFDALKALFLDHWAVRGYFSDSLLEQEMPKKTGDWFVPVFVYIPISVLLIRAKASGNRQGLAGSDQ
jgi:hypothetical protein